MVKLNARRPRSRAPRFIGTTPSAPTARNMLAGVGDALNAIGARRDREAEVERQRADRVALARAESDFILQQGRALDEAGASYDGAEPGFADAQTSRYDAAMAAALQNAPDRIRPELEARIAGPLRSRHLLAAGEVERNRTSQYALQGFSAHVDATSNAIMGEPGYFPDALASLETAVEGLPPPLQARAREEAVAQVSRSYAEARLLSDPAGFIVELESGELDPVFPAEVRRSYTGQAEREVEQRERAARIERDRSNAIIERRIDRALDDAEAAAEQGFTPDVSFAELGAAAASLGTEEGEALRTRAAEAAALAQLTEDLRLLPPAALEARIAEERANLRDGASGFEARRVETAESVLSNMRRELDQDPVAYARRTGVGDVPALDLSSTETLTASLRERASRAQAVADHYGVERRVFTRAERQALAQAVERGDLDRLALAHSMVGGLGRDAPAALAELVPDEPLLAVVGGLVSAGADDSARDLAAGYELRTQDGFNSRLPGSQIVSELVTASTGDLAERLPNTVVELTDAAEAIYETRALRRGMVRDGNAWPSGGEALFERALNEAAGAIYVGDRRYGGLVEHRGSTVIVPNWLREDRLDDALRVIASGDHGPRALMTDARGRPLSMDLLERARLQSVGDQRYLVRVGRNDGVALDETGSPFILDLSAYQRDLTRAYPEWTR